MNWKDDSGMTLTELLVVSVLMVIVLASAWSIMYTVSSLNNTLSASAMATDESQVFLDTVGRELRQADNLKNLSGVSTSNADAQGAFLEILPRQMTFYLDLYHNGQAKKVQYYMNGTSLWRKEWGSTNNTYPYTWATNPTSTRLQIASVDPAWNGPIFTYYTDDDWPATQITSASQADKVTAVVVEVQNLQTWGSTRKSYRSSMTIRVRAIDNKF